MGKVLIKCIQTPMQKYFYDRSLDSVVMVNDEEYQILKLPTPIWCIEP